MQEGVSKMVSCPHSIYFFRGSVDDFKFMETYKGEKSEEELTEIPNPLLNRENEGNYYRSTQTFVSNDNFVIGSGYTIKAGTYLCVIYDRDNDACLFDNFGDNVVNTLRDWHIVPLERPVIAPPQQKLHTVEIPGANGILDLSNSITKYPTFSNRTGSLKFAVLNDETDTLTAYTKMMRFLQGTNVKMILEDDPIHFYEGRVYVDNVDPKADGTWTEFSLGYDLYPYRKSVYSSVDEWLWNPFNFETDVVQNSVFDNVEINSPNSWDTKDFKDLIDMMPVIPEITVSDAMQCQLYNSDLGITWKTFNLSPNVKKYPGIILCEFTAESKIKMRFKGTGIVTIKFRSGRL